MQSAAGAAVGGIMVVVGHAAAFPAVMYEVSSTCVRAGGGCGSGYKVYLQKRSEKLKRICTCCHLHKIDV